MTPLDLNTTIGPDGEIADTAARQLDAWKRANAPADGRMDVRLQIGARVRSMPQHNKYFAMLGDLALQLVNAGLFATKDSLHIEVKRRLLPEVAAEVLRETGEHVDYERTLEMLDGTRVRTLSTTRLSVPAFTVLIDRLIEFAAEHGCDLSGHLGDMERSGDRLRIGGIAVRTGKIDEPSDLEGFKYAEEPAPEPADADPVYGLDAGAAGQEGQLAALFENQPAGPYHQGT